MDALSLPTFLVPYGHTTIAQQFTAGSPGVQFLFNSPVGTVENGVSGFDRPYGTDWALCALLPGDKSPGYSPTTLRVEILPRSKHHD